MTNDANSPYRYRKIIKQPKEVTAFRYYGNGALCLPDWFLKLEEDHWRWSDESELVLYTKRNQVIVKFQDWVLRTKTGKFKTCGHKNFIKKYQHVKVFTNTENIVVTGVFEPCKPEPWEVDQKKALEENAAANAPPAVRAEAFEYQGLEFLPKWLHELNMPDCLPDPYHCVFIQTKKGRNLRLIYGDWVVREPNGSVFSAFRHEGSTRKADAPLWFLQSYPNCWDSGAIPNSICLLTKEGRIDVKEGDWIIDTDRGEFKTITDEEFKATYTCAQLYNYDGVAQEVAVTPQKPELMPEAFLKEECSDYTNLAGKAEAFEYKGIASLPEWFKKIPMSCFGPESCLSIHTKDEGNLIFEIGDWIVREADGRVHGAFRYFSTPIKKPFYKRFAALWFLGAYGLRWQHMGYDLKIETKTGEQFVDDGDWIIGDADGYLKSYTDAEFKAAYAQADVCLKQESNYPYTTPAGKAEAFEYKGLDSLPEWFKKIPVLQTSSGPCPHLFINTKEEGGITIEPEGWMVHEADGRVYQAFRYERQALTGGCPIWFLRSYNHRWYKSNDKSVQITTTTGTKQVNKGDWIIGDIDRYLRSYTDAEFRNRYGLDAV